jgi:glucose/arabinose dehydrogenase
MIMKYLLLLIPFFGISQTIDIQSFGTGFTKPVEIVNSGDTRLFVVEQTGRIKILNTNGATNATPFLNLSGLVSTNANERGLLGLAFHPNYATNGFFFVNYTNLSGNTVIARYSRSSGAGSSPDIASTTGTTLLTITQPFNNHNGGSLKFGPDGYLYIGMGDGGSGNDPGNRSQNINENLGKMLRIDVNSTVAPFYTNPSTNPYVGVSGNDEIWAIGLRNPWKFSFNRLNGDLWIADVGQDAREEVNKIPSPLPATANFGWRCYEGDIGAITSGCVAQSSTYTPIAAPSHAAPDNNCSITGGYVYTGSTYPNLLNNVSSM